MASGCLRCGHPRTEHEHFTSSRHCSRALGEGVWCDCRRYLAPVFPLLDAARVVLRGRKPQPCRCRADADAALFNVLLFGRFADPTRLPPWPPQRAQQILQRIPRGPRFIEMPDQRVIPRKWSRRDEE